VNDFFSATKKVNVNNVNNPHRTVNTPGGNQCFRGTYTNPINFLGTRRPSSSFDDDDDDDGRLPRLRLLLLLLLLLLLPYSSKLLVAPYVYFMLLSNMVSQTPRPSHDAAASRPGQKFCKMKSAG